MGYFFSPQGWFSKETLVKPFVLTSHFTVPPVCVVPQRMSQRWRQFWCTNVQTCRGKLSLFPFWYFLCSVLIRLCPPFLSRNQLSRHSMLPQPPTPTLMVVCLTPSPSPVLLFHWPCIFLKQIFIYGTPPPPPHHLLSKSKPCTPSSCPSPPCFLIAPPPDHQPHSPQPYPPKVECGRICQQGVPPIAHPLVV